MQRIMIVSDSHRRHGNLAEAIYNEQPFDLLIHLGDIEGEEDIIQELAGGETIMVPVSYTHLRAHETDSYLVCRLLLEKKKTETTRRTPISYAVFC